MSKNYFGDLFNTPAFNALQRIQDQLNNSALSITMKGLQRTIDSIKMPTDGIVASLQSYNDAITPLLSSMQQIEALYSPILEQTKQYEGIYNNVMISALQSSEVLLKTIADLDLPAIQDIVNSFPKYDFLFDKISKSIDFNSIGELYDEGKITDDDIAEEFNAIVSKKNFSLVDTWNNIKKAKWFLAVRLILVILMFLGSPVIDKVKDTALESFGVNEFWEESGIYEWIENAFGVDKERNTVSEQEAKETVVKNNVGNISKQKREDLLNKIKAIRAFISAAPQDENTGNLLSYLSELEKDVNGKKYGLVFEEHREEIDEVLDTHTPVLTEEKDLFIDNGGQMNFLIEGDNLASLKLLEKTHKGKIDLIYIDPPYNTGVNDFIYDDDFVEKTDLFRHSKWLSFMKNRLEIAYKLLSENGYIFISIDDNEVAPLTLLCDEIFHESNHINTITINMNSLSGVKMTHAVKGKRFPAQKEYLLLYKRGATPPQLFIEKKHKEKWDKEYNLIIPELEKGQFDSFATMTDSSVNAILKNMHLQSLSSYVSEKGIKLTDDWLWGNAYRIFGTKSNRPLANRIKDEIFSQQIMCYKNNDGNIRYFRSDFNRNARDPRIELVQAKANSSVFLSDNWIDISNDGGVAQEGGVIFPNGKKPLQLIIRVLRASNNLRATVLDFFAGSGTTGHAVIKLNAEDGGNRKFILCTNNENNICRDVTYERIRRVIDKEGYAASLKYYKVEYVPISDRLYYEYADELLKHVRELVELENGINFTGNAEIAIVLTEEELADFVNHLDELTRCKKLYMGHDLLPTGEQEEALQRHDIEINIIPDYYYKDLQER